MSTFRQAERKAVSLNANRCLQPEATSATNECTLRLRSSSDRKER